MSDNFQIGSNASRPGRRARSIAPHDVNPLVPPPNWIWVGGAGNITLRGIDDDTDTVFVGVPAGTVLPFQARYVRATGTTATNMLAVD